MSLILRRHGLLTRAARAGAALYRRDRDLSHLVPGMTAQRSRKAVMAALVAAEANCESDRKTGAASYSLQRHVGLLAALFAETEPARG